MGNETELGEVPRLGKSGEGLMDIKIAHKTAMFIGEEEGGDSEVVKEGGGISIHTNNNTRQKKRKHTHTSTLDTRLRILFGLVKAEVSLFPL